MSGFGSHLPPEVVVVMEDHPAMAVPVPAAMVKVTMGARRLLLPLRRLPLMRETQGLGPGLPISQVPPKA
jgi:hypothetical protein